MSIIFVKKMWKTFSFRPLPLQLLHFQISVRSELKNVIIKQKKKGEEKNGNKNNSESGNQR